MRSIYCGAAIALLVTLWVCAAPGALADPIKADIVWVVDTSGSMSGDIAEIKSRIMGFNTAMTTAGIDAHYALVEFGGRSGNGYTSGTATLYQDVTDYTTFTATDGAFDKLSAASGGTESGSLATSVGLSDATFRSGSVLNFILVTDEDDDSSVTEFNAANAGLTAKDALFNFIGVPGVGNTDSRYGVLASGHGGAAFSITAFRADPSAFFTNFTTTKVKEIQDAVPEPGSIALLALGLVGLGWVARRRRIA